MSTVTCAVAGFLVFACELPEPAPPAARFCQLYAAPVPYKASTDERTKRRLRDLNAKYRALCEGAR